MANRYLLEMAGEELETGLFKTGNDRLALYVDFLNQIVRWRPTARPLYEP